jgi:hypothetical protein
VAQTRKRRRRKHRGTQGGSIDRRGRAARPRSREEARARARKNMGQKRDQPPTWSGAVTRAAFGAGIFLLLLILIFKRPIVASLLLSVLMLGIYIPFGHALDGFMYRRKLRARQREHEARKGGD